MKITFLRDCTTDQQIARKHIQASSYIFYIPESKISQQFTGIWLQLARKLHGYNCHLPLVCAFSHGLFAVHLSSSWSHNSNSNLCFIHACLLRIAMRRVLLLNLWARDVKCLNRDIHRCSCGYSIRQTHGVDVILVFS